MSAVRDGLVGLSYGLEEFCADLEREFRPLAEERGLSFGIDLDPILPRSIAADRRHLGLILRNLLSNAFKFTHEGGVTLWIASAFDDEQIVFSVADTGNGANGLELSIAHETAHRLGGEIQVESVPGLGSRVSLLVPTGAAPAPAPASDPEPVALPAGSDAASGDRVLIVLDSDPARARAMLKVVHRRGGKAILADETAAALELAREHRLDGVLLAGDASRIDSGLAELKGHAETRHMPVVAIGGQAARLPALRLGAAAFVERSLDAYELQRALARLETLSETPDRRVALIGPSDRVDPIVPMLGRIDGLKVVRIDEEDAAIALRASRYDLAVMSLDAPHTDAVAALRRLVTDEALRDMPLLAYVPPELTQVQRAHLDALARAAVIAVVDTPELLADRAALFLHRHNDSSWGATGYSSMARA